LDHFFSTALNFQASNLSAQYCVYAGNEQQKATVP